MPPKDAQYSPLGQYDIDEESDVYSDSSTKTLNAVNSLRVLEWVTLGILTVLSALFFILWITSAPKCTYMVKYSPANEVIEYIENVKYKGTLYFKTPWRGEESLSGNPSPEIDANWRHISTDVKPIRITKEQLHEMKMDISPTIVDFPEEEGGGYLASLEVTHHLQCLDMLRKATFREYYESFDPTFQIDDETLMNQLDTCVEVLRQALMCYPDLNMVTYYWTHGYKAPHPDINSVHRCKNFDKVLDWAAERAVDIPTRSKLGGVPTSH